MNKNVSPKKNKTTTESALTSQNKDPLRNFQNNSGDTEKQFLYVFVPQILTKEIAFIEKSTSNFTAWFYKLLDNVNLKLNIIAVVSAVVKTCVVLKHFLHAFQLAHGVQWKTVLRVHVRVDDLSAFMKTVFVTNEPKIRGKSHNGEQ